MTLDLDRAVLLPIDMQRGFDEPGWPRRWNANADANRDTHEHRDVGTNIHANGYVDPGGKLVPGDQPRRERAHD